MTLLIRTILFALLAAGSSASFAQAAFPARPITLVVPFGAGSGTDQHARLLAKEVSDELKVPVVVDNRPGANGVIAAQAVKAAPADGHTWLLATNSTQVINQVLTRKLPFDPLVDLSPVRGLTRGYQVMVVAANSPIKDVASFVAYTKSKAGGVTFGSGSAASQMGGELFKYRANVQMLHVPYKASPGAVTDLIGGQIDTMFVDLPVAMPLLSSGRVRALAVSAPKRLASLPAVPTFPEAGVAGYTNSFWSGLYVRAGTPPAILQRIGVAISRANAAQPVAAYLEKASIERLDQPAAALEKLQAEELTLWRGIAAKTGIIPE
ncbi:MAG: tripartite tricarboxylate transporter substrate binding protein [Ramlibacter sp.]